VSLPAWLTDPGLEPLWSAARRQLARRQRSAEGVVSVTGLQPDARRAIGGLLGRPLTGARVRVDLSELDADLRRRAHPGGLLAVVEELAGQKVPGRRAEQDALAAGRAELLAAGRRRARASPALAEEPWLEGWLEQLARSGRLARWSVTVPVLVRALDVVEAVVTGTATSRVQLAAEQCGNAHALDDGTVAAALVLRALAARAGTPVPSTAAQRRAVWEGAGVLPDLVSATCLTLGLATWRPSVPVHLTAWDLRHARDEALGPPGRGVVVCENPRVLEAVAQEHGGHFPVVCTSGQPSLVAVQVLHALAAGGHPLLYHGDFDWPGLAIAQRLVRLVGVRPWLMTAEDYAAGADGDRPPLTGLPVDVDWDPALRPTMESRGVAVHEELVLPQLLAQLPGAAGGS